VIYTSGSTGRPKGVLALHRGAMNAFRCSWETFPFDANHVCCQQTSQSFVDAVCEIFYPLLAGVRTVIIPDEILKNPSQLIQTLATQHVMQLSLVPSLLHTILDICPDIPNRLPHLKIWDTGGEALSIELLARFQESLPQGILRNYYGSSEVSSYVTCYELEKDQSFSCFPIGRPIANTQIYLLDSCLQPVPIGMPGEMYIGGEGLARGYLNQPGLSAEKFIPDPFGDKPGARLYKTGDLARYLPDGNIEFLGRVDQQAKIRGFRIELSEIEAALDQHPDVWKTVVLAREDVPGRKYLAAYVVPDQEQTPAPYKLRDFVKQKLPDYMVPAAFILLDTLPLTPNGKIDRRALPAPDQSRPELPETFVAPRDYLELELVKIWEEILGIQPVGTRDNFFDLGGNSLLAMRLLAQIEKTFNKSLSLATLFQAPTVEQLTPILHRSQEERSASASSLVALQLGGSKPPFFCLPGNLGNVFTDLGDLARHLGPDQPFYGLQDGIHNPTQIKALAAHYLDKIQSVQPDGPYLLGGVCSGGTIAFEMAQQLQTQGQQVALLALMETPPPQVPGLRSYLDFAVSTFQSVTQRFVHHSRNVSQLGSAEQGAYFRLKAKLVVNDWALTRYAPRPYPGRIHLFLGSESLESPLDPCLGWRELALGGAEVHVVPGTHDTITRTHDAALEESHLRVLAEQLRTCIDDALANGYNS
jgi:thioesterase domain-containing protein/acyl carrier protein